LARTNRRPGTRSPVSAAPPGKQSEAILRVVSRRRRLTRLVRATGPCDLVARLSAARAGEINRVSLPASVPHCA
jgi:hypothetical protein